MFAWKKLILASLLISSTALAGGRSSEGSRWGGKGQTVASSEGRGQGQGRGNVRRSPAPKKAQAKAKVAPAQQAVKNAAKVKKNVLARIEAAPGSEGALQDLLTGALSIAQAEKLTIQWFAFKVDNNTFGVFDTFFNDLGRNIHLNGEIPAALNANANLLGAAPSIENGDIIATNFNGNAKQLARVKFGVVAQIVAAPGREAELQALLVSAAGIVRAEPGTRHWFAFRLNANTFGIFDTFENVADRDLHLNGQVPAALGANADLLGAAPVIETVDLLAVKP